MRTFECTHGADTYVGLRFGTCTQVLMLLKSVRHTWGYEGPGRLSEPGERRCLSR